MLAHVQSCSGYRMKTLDEHTEGNKLMYSKNTAKRKNRCRWVELAIGYDIYKSLNIIFSYFRMTKIIMVEIIMTSKVEQSRSI